MRTNKVILIAGTRGTGKTNFLKELINKMRKRFLKCLVADTFDSEVWKDLKTYHHPENSSIKVPIIPLNKFSRWKKGIGRVFSSDTDKIMRLIQKDAKNTFIVFEDATKYVENKLTKDVRMFVLDSKQKNLDLVFVFHSLMAIPPELIRISDVITLFLTGDAKVPSKFDAFPGIEKTFQNVKEKSKTNRYYNETLILN